MDTTSTGARDIETVVIGGGQAGLSTGYHLAKRGREFVILDAYERVGDNWRCHWDSLRLYSPALAACLPGMEFPAPRTSYPTKDEMADFLEAYRARFELPVRGGVRVSTVRREGERYVVTCTDGSSYRCDNVVVATGTFGRTPNVPAFAGELDAGDPAAALQRLQAPVAAEAGSGARGRRVALGRRHRLRGGLGGPPGRAQRAHPRGGPVPDREAGRRRSRSPSCSSWPQHVLTMRTPIGRKMRPEIRAHGGPLIRVKKADLAGVGVEMTRGPHRRRRRTAGRCSTATGPST